MGNRSYNTSRNVAISKLSCSTRE